MRENSTNITQKSCQEGIQAFATDFCIKASGHQWHVTQEKVVLENKNGAKMQIFELGKKVFGHEEVDHEANLIYLCESCNKHYCRLRLYKFSVCRELFMEFDMIQ